MIRYAFKDDELPIIKNAKNANAQKIGEALADILTDAGGELRTERALEAATDPDHPLHPHLEWDNKIAGHKYRLHQTRAVIRCIRIVDEETERPMPAFLSISDRGGTSYRSVQDVRSSSDLRILVLKQAESDLEAWERRYQDISDACKLVSSARSRVRKRRERLESMPDA